MLQINKIHKIDALQGLKQLESNSIDLIVSDSPYQLDSTRERFGKKGSAEAKYGTDGAFQRASKGFMGKEWDVLPEVDVLKECLRVIKAGAFSFWLMTPRQDSQAEFITRLKQAGFNIGFTPLYWAYASGFPKAGNIGKMVDKRMGAEREVIGKKESGIGKAFNKGQWRSESEEVDITTPQAKALDGSYAGFQPKPAVEVIIVAMKPLTEKTYVEQALKNNKGITWLDDVRIPYVSDGDRENSKVGFIDGLKCNTYMEESLYNRKEDYKPQQGRFPANLLVSDDVLNDGSVTKSTTTSSVGGWGTTTFNNNRDEVDGLKISYERGHNDSGSFSRYFDLDKWHINKLPDSVKKTFPFMIVPKASSGEKNDGLNEFEGKYMDESREIGSAGGCNPRNRGAETERKNFHPTVKPTKLMEYLITLGSREGDIVLDCFAGSGTTAIASRILTRNFICFERDAEYHKIAEARIKDYMEQTKLTEMIK